MDNLSKNYEFTLFYDGDCPICQKEVAWLSRLNSKQRLGLQDINATDFIAENYGKSHAELMAEIHGLYPDGTVIKGVPVFRAAYQAVGLGWLVAPTGWPVFNIVFAQLYTLFAKHRIYLGGLLGAKRCQEEVCGLEKDK